MVVLLACDLLSCACVGSCILCALIQSGTIGFMILEDGLFIVVVLLSLVLLNLL